MTASNHVWEEHKNCKEPSCPICGWGARVCTVCGCAEGELTQKCSGTHLSGETRKKIMTRELDFDGEWFNPRKV